MRHLGIFLSRLQLSRDLVGRAASIPIGVDSNVNRHLFELHFLYKRAKAYAKNAEFEIDQMNRLNDIRDQVHGLMRIRGLQDPFSASFDGGAVFTDSGDDAIPSLGGKQESTTAFQVAWESMHWHDEEGPWDVSFGGHFGLGPAQSLVCFSDDSACTAKPDSEVGIRTIFQPAFKWDFAPRFNLQTEKRSELSLLARFGQSWLTSDTVAYKVGDNTINTRLLPNGVGTTAWFQEYGAEWRMFNKDMMAIHEEKTFTTPAFSISAGYRNDQRLNAPKIDGTTPLDNPNKRLFFRMLISLPRIVRQSAIGKVPETFALRFAVEHERGMPGSTTLPGTRFMVLGDVNVAKLITGGGE